ncbi:MAG: SH3 domain-containing protein, partial [Anaerolineae bacterium]|nr:SH3 domain-containing protein [Anaerolineae bacterium]
MSTSTRAPLYDLFKLIVTIILIFLFLFLLWNGGTGPSTPPIPTLTPLPLTGTVAPASSTFPASTETPTSTAIPPTNSPTPSPTSPPPTVTSTPTIAPTIPPVTETLPTPIVEIPSEPEVCAAVSRSQLQVGMQAIIQRRLNFRTSPGIMNNWIKTNLPGTPVEVIGGPECTRYKNGGAYLWWQIRLPDGQIGWSAEASAFGAFYFMEPA